MAQNVVSMENFHFQWFLLGAKRTARRLQNGFRVTKKDGAGKTPPETKRNRKHSEERKGTKLKI